MEVKYWQWARTDLGNIIQLSKIEIDKSIWECNDRLFYDTLTCTIIKVANTPQELIEVGDLVRSKLHNYTAEVTQVFDSILQLTIPYAGVLNNEITKILTPNSNGGYDLQWEGYNE